MLLFPMQSPILPSLEIDLLNLKGWFHSQQSDDLLTKILCGVYAPRLPRSLDVH